MMWTLGTRTWRSAGKRWRRAGEEAPMSQWEKRQTARLKLPGLVSAGRWLSRLASSKDFCMSSLHKWGHELSSGTMWSLCLSAMCKNHRRSDAEKNSTSEKVNACLRECPHLRSEQNKWWMKWKKNPNKTKYKYFVSEDFLCNTWRSTCERWRLLRETFSSMWNVTVTVSLRHERRPIQCLIALQRSNKNSQVIIKLLCYFLPFLNY